MKLEKKSDGKYGGVGGQGIISGSHKNTLYIYIWIQKINKDKLSKQKKMF